MKLLECERCNLRYCIKCLKKPVSEYNAISKSDCIWFCPPCKVKALHSVREDKDLETKFQEAIDSFQHKINSRFEQMQQEINTKVTEERVKEIIEETINKEENPESSTQKHNVQTKSTVVSNTIKEMKERCIRERNMIVYALEELKSANKEEREVNNKNMVKKLAAACEVEIQMEDIVSTRRLGKFDENDPKRPLLVVMKDSEIKRKIFRNGSKLRTNGNEFENISLAHDMTKTEREEEKILWSQAKKKQEESGGKHIFRVRGPPWDRRIIRKPAFQTTEAEEEENT